jgi:hypothetical protein
MRKPAHNLGGPGGIRTHDVLSEADYESAACNQHGVRPKKKDPVIKAGPIR